MSVQSGWSRFTWGQAYWNRDALLATGWGAKAWNDGEYGNLADETISLTGVSATSNIGAVGVLANALVEPTGISSTASTGSLLPADVVGLTGQLATISVAEFGTSTRFGIQAFSDVDTGSNTSYTSVATGSNTSYTDAA